MKKSLLFSAVLAGLMLGSCSSSDDLAGGNTPANQSGDGYVSLSLNLPTRSGSVSRAENDKFLLMSMQLKMVPCFCLRVLMRLMQNLQVHTH